MKQCIKEQIEKLDYEIQLRVNETIKAQIATAEHDYQRGVDDCKIGVYDKWYRYHRKDDGDAYDKGWVFQNQTTQCETVSFLPGL